MGFKTFNSQLSYDSVELEVVAHADLVTTGLVASSRNVEQTTGTVTETVNLACTFCTVCHLGHHMYNRPHTHYHWHLLLSMSLKWCRAKRQIYSFIQIFV